MLQNDQNRNQAHSNLGDPMKKNAGTNLPSGLAHTIIQLRVKIAMKM